MPQTLRVSDIEKSIVQVVVTRVDGTWVPQGTGFFLDENGLLATALHVFVGALKWVSDNRGGVIGVRRVDRGTKNWVSVPTSLVTVDAAHDTALLRVTDVSGSIWNTVGGIRPVRLTEQQEFDMLTLVTVAGYFGGDILPIVLQCRIAGTALLTPQPKVEIEEFAISGTVLPGQSGSPVLLEDGTVMGMAVSMVPVTLPFSPQQQDHSGISRAVKAEHIKILIPPANP